MYMINKHILTHISKGLVLVKLKLFQIYNNDKSSTNTGVGCHNRMCIKLKTIQVDKSYISNAQLTTKCIILFLYTIAARRKSQTQLS